MSQGLTGSVLVISGAMSDSVTIVLGPGNVLLGTRGTTGKPVRARGLLGSLWLVFSPSDVLTGSVIQVVVSRV
ncbi:hypothetical protein ES705_23481 [subsurface metagenome]